MGLDSTITYLFIEGPHRPLCPGDEAPDDEFVNEDPESIVVAERQAHPVLRVLIAALNSIVEVGIVENVPVVRGRHRLRYRRSSDGEDVRRRAVGRQRVVDDL